MSKKNIWDRMSIYLFGEPCSDNKVAINPQKEDKKEPEFTDPEIEYDKNGRARQICYDKNTGEKYGILPNYGDSVEKYEPKCSSL